MAKPMMLRRNESTEALTTSVAIVACMHRVNYLGPNGHEGMSSDDGETARPKPSATMAELDPAVEPRNTTIEAIFGSPFRCRNHNGQSGRLPRRQMRTIKAKRGRCRHPTATTKGSMNALCFDDAGPGRESDTVPRGGAREQGMAIGIRVSRRAVAARRHGTSRSRSCTSGGPSDCGIPGATWMHAPRSPGLP